MCNKTNKEAEQALETLATKYEEPKDYICPQCGQKTVYPAGCILCASKYVPGAKVVRVESPELKPRWFAR